MTTRLLSLVLAVCLLSSVAARSFAQNCQDKLSATKASMVELFVTGTNSLGTNKINIFGSGFIVHSDSGTNLTYIFTAAHVLNPLSGERWADKPLGSGPDRTIRVSLQQPDNQFKVLSDDATVIVENRDVDFAVLATPQRTVQTLKLGSSSVVSQRRSIVRPQLIETE
jgi:hypothetical protein